MSGELLGVRDENRIEPQRVIDSIELVSPAVQVQEDMYEILKNESPVILFHYLRFDVFKDVTIDELGKLLKLLASVSCKDPAFLKPFIDFAKKKDIQGCTSLASVHTGEGKAIIDKLKSEGHDIVQVKDPNEIIDVYLKEKSPKYALALLESLLFFEITDDGTVYKQYIQSIIAGIQEDMKEYIFHGKTYHGFQI
jgi:hypothetical protein